MKMIENSIRANDLPKLLASVPQGVEYLSLDCFDTLIWRNVNVPTDVFADLALGANGVTQRLSGESMARQTAFNLDGRKDVRIEEIYAQVLPNGSAEDHASHIAAELDAEARHCFAFAPTRDLIADARRRGMKVIIVSDIYMSEPQLRRLITRVGGDELIGMIDRIFVSSEYGLGKADGLFEIVLDALQVAPGAMVHVGDNAVADYTAPSRLGIHSVHLRQFGPETEQRLRLEAGVSSIIEPASRTIRPVLQPHRAALSLRTNDDPAFALGYDVLGPIMYNFASWIRAEAEAMEAKVGKPVKLAFLLRDGHLPGEAFKALFPDWADRVAMVEISRFTAQAAAFTNAAAVNDYLVPRLGEDDRAVFRVKVKDICTTQMLFDEAERVALGRNVEALDYLKAVMLPSNLRKILSRSAKYAERLFAYLRAQGIADGDAVMLVDLGYNGSVQNALETVLPARMGLTLAGRYLGLREAISTGYDKKGLLDSRHYDAAAISIPWQPIAILEQFCTMAQGSVMDYRPNGTPIRSAPGVKGAQSACRETAQEGCLAFVRAADRGFVRPPLSDDADARRRATMATLTRMLTLPLANEVALVKNFHHDTNMGTAGMMEMMDIEASETSLRRRGLLYLRDARRMYLAGELQGQGIITNLAILTAKRFGIDLRKNDIEAGAISIPVEVVDGHVFDTMEAEAHPTADGYYRALIPVGKGRYTIGLWLGRLYDYVQFDEIGFHPLNNLTTEKDAVPGAPITEAMQEVAPGLYRCDGPQSFMLIPPPASEKELLLSIVFRPVISHARQAERQMAA
jgi:FMN phosphatase YigB (HAD superfamily)